MFRIICILFVLCAVNLKLPATDVSYRQEVEKTAIQRIEWVKDGSALDYLVEIQSQTGSGWVEAYSKTTERNFVEVSLPHGQYRYRITPSDLLGRRISTADWADLSVLQLRAPRLEGFSPDTVYLEDESAKAGISITLSGDNLLPDSKVYLRSVGGVEVSGSVWSADGSGKNGILKYETGRYEAGIYSVVVENPGGLEAALGNFRIEQGGRGGRETGGAFRISEGYAPLIGFPGVFNDLFSRRFFETGAVIRVDWMAIRARSFVFGLEFQTSFHFLSAPLRTGDYSEYTMRANLVGLRANGFCELSLLRHLHLKARGGGGVAILGDVHLEDIRLSSPPKGGWLPLVGAGISVVVPLFQALAVELSGDFLYGFSVDSPPPVYIMPSLSLGYTF